MDSAKNVTATFNTPPKLTIVKIGTGIGTVTATTGINCGNDCEELYAANTVVDLSANPSSGSSFRGWIAATRSGKGPCSVTMAQAKTVVAAFDLPSTCVANGEMKLDNTQCCPGTLECEDRTCRSQCTSCGVQGSTANGGVVCCSGLTKCSDNVCRATCAQRCTQEGARAASGSSCCPNLTRCANGTCQRSCVVQTYQLTVGRLGPGSGTITGNSINCGSVCATSLPSGTVVSLSASAAAGSTVGR